MNIRIQGKILILVVLLDIFPMQPTAFYNHCNSSSDCEEEECCVIGRMRYSIPRCQHLGSKGDVCRPENRAENFTLWYPNGKVIHLHDTFPIACPCREPYTCNTDERSCELPEVDNAL